MTALAMRAQDARPALIERLALYRTVDSAGSVTRLMTFLKVCEGGATSQQDIATALGESRALVSANLHVLHHLRLIDFKPDPDHGRKLRPVLAARGRELQRVMGGW